MAAALPFIMIGGQLLGGISKANAAKQEAAAQTAQLQAQAAADDFNRRIALQNIEITKSQTQAAVDKADRERRLRQGAAVASAGGMGLGSGGNVMDILSSNAAQEELNLLTIRNEGLLQERSFANQAALLGASSQNTLAQIPGVKRAGKTAATSALLSGITGAAGSAYDKWG